MSVVTTYQLQGGEGTEAITCLICGKTSFHPMDISTRYCGSCKRFHEAPLFVFFDDSPDVGAADCLCSVCRKRIGGDQEEDDDHPPDTPIRLWTSGTPCLEARFHEACFAELTARGILKATG